MDYVVAPRQIAYPLRHRRKELGMTQDDLARAAGVSRQLVNKAEAGLAPGIGLDRLLRMLEALGLSLAVASPGDTDASRVPPARPIARQNDEYRKAFAKASELSPQTAALLGMAACDDNEGHFAEDASKKTDGGAQ